MALFNVLFDIAARTAKFEQSMTRVERRLDNTAKAFKAIGSVAGGAFALTGIRAFIDSAVQFGDDIKTIADRMQTTTEILTRLQYVAEQVDAPFETLRTSLDQLEKNLAKAADGSGRARAALKALGVEADFLIHLPIEQQLNVLADAFHRLKTPAEQIRVAMELFGGEGAALVPVLRLGSAGIRTLGDEGARVGAILADKTATALGEVDSATKRLTASSRVARAELAALIAQPLGYYLETWSRGARRVRDALGLLEKTPLEELRADLLRVNTEMNRLGVSDAKRSQLNDAALQLSKLIAAYEQADADHDRIMQSFARREADLAKGGGAMLPEIEVRAPRRDRDIEDWLGVRVTARKIELGAMEEFYRDLDDQTQTSIERQVSQYEAFKSKLDVLFSAGRIDTRAYNARLQESLDEILQPVEVTSRRIEAIAEEGATRMSEFSLEAARNMQDAFADFLFDPFEDGLKGMLRGFVDVIRRMVAEAAAAQLFGSLFNGGSGFLGKALGGLFGGARAEGGPVSTGRSYLVGERGPELFVPRSSGGIVPTEALSASSGVVFAPVYNISGLGLSYEQVNLLLRQSNEQMVRALTDRRVRR